MNFNFNAKYIFLTYPQCSASKEEILDHIQTLHQVKDYIVCEEKHEDGSPHIHAVLHFHTKVHTRDPKHFDYGGFHPHIKSPRDSGGIQRCIEYCKKEGNYLSSFKETIGKRAILAQKILEEGTITKKLILENPEIIFLNHSSVKQWLGYVQPKPILPPGTSVLKLRHIWLYGTSNTGKTYWLYNYLNGYDSPQEIPLNNDFSHIDESTDLLYIDEYKGTLTVQQINKLCDGYTRLNTKGSSTRILNPTICIVSNYSIRDCYQKIDDMIYQTLLNRFIEYDAQFKLPPFRRSIIKN